MNRADLYDRAVEAGLDPADLESSDFQESRCRRGVCLHDPRDERCTAYLYEFESNEKESTK